MRPFHLWITSIFLFLSTVGAASLVPRSTSQRCTPFRSTFASSDVSHGSNETPFTVISPKDSYRVDKEGLILYLEKPAGKIKTHGGVNNIVAEGATVNATSTILYGKVTFELSAPAVAGVVTAAILIADEHDEIDVELVGGDPAHWQTNIFAPSTKDKGPLWGVFSGVEEVSAKSSKVQSDITSLHKYTIDWTEQRIVWSVDDTVVRTLHKAETEVNGTTHYPSHAARVQLGIWDASNPAGTSEWARGPIDWKTAPKRMSATFKSVKIEC